LLLRKKLSLRYYALLLGSYILSIGLLARLLNVDLHGYITGSLHLIDAYNDAMSLAVGNNVIFLFAALFILLLAFIRLPGLISTSIRKKTFRLNADELTIHGILCFALFILYKSGFVRADNYHIWHFFNIVSLPAAAIYLYCPPTLKKRTAALFCWIILGVASVAANTTPEIERSFSFRRQLSLLQITKFSTYFHELTTYGQAATAGASNVSADVIPTEISKVYFSGLRYNPRPVIQSYSAYDSYLDSLNYEKYMSPGAPDYVLFSLKSIDNRYPFFDESKTKLAILSHYTPVARNSPVNPATGSIGDDLLLKKKDLAPLVRSKETTWVHVRLGQDIPIPPRTDLQYSRIFVHYTAWGQLKRCIYQPPALTITLFPEEGESFTYKAIPTMLEDGMLSNRYIGTTQDFQLLLQSAGRLGTPIKKIRIDEDPNNRGFEQEREMGNSWYSYPPRPDPERIADSLEVAKLNQEWQQYKPERTDSRLYQQDSFRCQIENRTTYSPMIQIQGWGFRENASNGAIIVKAVLVSADTMYTLPSERQRRYDLTSYFHRNDIVGCGFKARVSKSQLPPGTYKIGIALEDTLSHKKWICYTPSTLQR